MRISDWSSDVCSSDLRDGFLTDVEVAETADQAEAVKLPRLLLKAADEQHFAIEFLELFGRRVIGDGVARRLAIGRGGWGGCGLFRRGGGARRCFGQGGFLCI